MDTEPIGDESSGFDVHWAIPLDEPMSLPVHTPTTAEPMLAASEARESADGFLLRGDDLPTDGIHRPRLGRFEDAA